MQSKIWTNMLRFRANFFYYLRTCKTWTYDIDFLHRFMPKRIAIKNLSVRLWDTSDTKRVNNWRTPSEKNRSALYCLTKSKRRRNRIRGFSILIYEYDYGDGWEIEINVKKVEDVKSYECPKLLQAKGNMVIDDCGGPTGLNEIETSPADINGLNLILEETFEGWRL